MENSGKEKENDFSQKSSNWISSILYSIHAVYALSHGRDKEGASL